METSTTLLADVRSLAMLEPKTSKRKHKQMGMLSMPPGPKTKIDAKYIQARREFLDLISREQAKAVYSKHPELAKKGAISVLMEEGRKFDKVLIAFFPDATDRSKKPEVRYFIDRRDGTIYGAKSPLAPNTKWYFGNVKDAVKWDWSGYHGVPHNEQEAGVRKVGGYKGVNEYNHYEPVRAA